MSTLCSLKNINLAFGQKVIFKDASFQIEFGDKIGLIGLNGMGKSSLFNILMGNLIPDTSSPAFTFDKANDRGGPNTGFSVFLVEQKFRFPKEPVTSANYY